MKYTRVGVNTYTYDSESRLVIANLPQAGEAIYTYDPFGRRISLSLRGAEGDEAISYIYDGDDIICETDSLGITTAKYIFGPGIDEPIAMQRQGQTYYYHFDGLGSVTALTNTAGETVETYSYDAYGKPNTTSTLGNPYMFTGREYDSETGLYYYRARMYSPELGRFLQTDPIGYWGGINLYTYCNNNPINWIDPFGWCKDKPWWKDIGDLLIPPIDPFGPRIEDRIKGITSQDIIDRLLGVGTAYAGETTGQQETALPMPITWRGWIGMILMGAGGAAIKSSPSAGLAAPAVFTGGVIVFVIGGALTIWDVYASSKEAFEKTKRILEKIQRQQIEGYGFTKDELRELRL